MAKAKHYYHNWQTGLDGRYQYCTVCHAVEKKDAPTISIPSPDATLAAADEIAQQRQAARTKHVTGVWQDFPTDRPTPPPAPTPPEPAYVPAGSPQAALKEYGIPTAGQGTGDISPTPEPEPPAPTTKASKRKELRAWLEAWSQSHEYPALTLYGEYGKVSGTVAAGPENWTAWLKAAKVSELEQGQKAASVPITLEELRAWLWTWGERYHYPALTIPMHDNIEHRVAPGGDGWAIWLALSDQEVLARGRMLALCQFPAEPPQVEREETC